jgi:2C-methyl-D-erythritol 2,4-cyclodiphosphate synthase
MIKMLRLKLILFALIVMLGGCMMLPGTNPVKIVDSNPLKKIKDFENVVTLSTKVLKGYNCIKIDIQLIPSSNPVTQKLQDKFVSALKSALQTAFTKIKEKNFQNSDLQICVSDEDCSCKEPVLLVVFKEKSNFHGSFQFVDAETQKVLVSEEL